MDLIVNTQRNSFKIPSIFSEILDNKKFALFDIETTGLNPNYNKVILIGILYIEDENIVIKQFFCNKSYEEPKLLKSFISVFKDFDFYITFNGGNFDIPFLNKRFSKYGLDYKIDPYLNFDLYKVVRKNKNLLGLNNCKLKTIEKYLGIDRRDTIDGKESVRLFKSYEATGDIDLKEKILLHNFEDILHLLPTLNILNLIDKNRVFVYLPKEFLFNDELKIRIIDYKIKNDFLLVSGSFHENLNRDFVFFDHAYSFSLLRENNQFNLKVPLLNIHSEKKANYTFINLNEIDYLKANLSQMDNNEKSKYVVRIGNEIKDFNIYNFIKDFSLHILENAYKNN